MRYRIRYNPSVYKQPGIAVILNSKEWNSNIERDDTASFFQGKKSAFLVMP